VQKHFPNGGVTEVLGTALTGIQLNKEVIVRTFESGGHRGNLLVERDASHILSHLFERVVESMLVVFSLALAETDKAMAIANENKHSPLVDSVQTGHVGN